LGEGERKIGNEYIGEDEEKNGSQNDFSIEKWPLFF
jgi:hypothetical protein